jgi:hypothetical protein
MNEMPEVDAFHAHLDCCKQCMNNPFDLCAEGRRLINAAADNLSIPNRIMVDLSRSNNEEI